MSRHVCRLIAVLWSFVAVGTATAQPSGVPIVRDSNVGYIDPAIPGDILRFRFDAAFRNVEPARAEFFYPRSGAAGPGPRLAETSVDYQELNAYLETALNPRVSLFVNTPARFLNPEVNDNASGFGDLDAGFKYALVHSPRFVATTQLRVFAPTGHAREGLGNDHVSLEPALLGYTMLSKRLSLEGELRYWIPIGGTDFAGDVLRYGIGAGYWLPLQRGWQIAPVAEFVGWTVLGGKTSRTFPDGGTLIEDAEGTTLVHAKLGARARVASRIDVFGGYGRPLTGDAWYEDTFRVELRWHY